MRSRQIGHSDASAPGTGIWAAIAAAADKVAIFGTLKNGRDKKEEKEKMKKRNWRNNNNGGKYKFEQLK